jgi:hypothetical protein
MTYQGLGLGYLTDDKARRPRAGDVPLIRAVRDVRPKSRATLRRWSAVNRSACWDFPPFLRSLEIGEFVGRDVSLTGNRTGSTLTTSTPIRKGAGSGHARRPTCTMPMRRLRTKGFRVPPSPSGCNAGIRVAAVVRSNGTCRGAARHGNKGQVGQLQAVHSRSVSQEPCPDASRVPK